MRTRSCASDGTRCATHTRWYSQSRSGVVGAVGAAEGPATAIALPGSLFSVGVGATLEVLMQSNNGGHTLSLRKKGLAVL